MASRAKLRLRGRDKLDITIIDKELQHSDCRDIGAGYVTSFLLNDRD